MPSLYFDYNATTPLTPSVQARLNEIIHSELGNPSSFHSPGRQTRDLIEQARTQIASMLGTKDREVIFTSGATESNNTVLQSVWHHQDRNPQRNKIITTRIEHSCILEPLKQLQSQGAQIEYLPVNPQGELDLKHLDEILDETTLLVSVMLANNETGILHPVAEIAKKAKQYGSLIHTDAACGLGKIELDFDQLGVDFLSLSGHKAYGPSGSGALLAKSGSKLKSLIRGGHQEFGNRAGTENLLGILGLAEGLKFALKDLNEERARLKNLREKLKAGLLAIDENINFNEHPKHQLEGTLNVRFSQGDGQTLLVQLDLKGVAASLGSACHSGSLDPSHVLLAMGLTDEEALRSLRFSFGRMTTEEEVDELIGIFKEVI